MVPNTGAVYVMLQWQWEIHYVMSFVPERSSYYIHMIKMNGSQGAKKYHFYSLPFAQAEANIY